MKRSLLALVFATITVFTTAAQTSVKPLRDGTQVLSETGDLIGEALLHLSEPERSSLPRTQVQLRVTRDRPRARWLLSGLLHWWTGNQ